MRFVEQDRGQHRAVIDAKGKESRGTGNAAATVTAQLQEDGDRTSVAVDTDLKIVGKLAQFGFQRFHELAAKNTKTAPDPASPSAAEPAPGPRHAAAEPEPIDLLDLAGGDQLKKYGAAAIAVLAVLVLIWVLRRRR